ncbi:hypothetical protein PFISCL1PPCAC_16880, partial [Pristionchus fissidentatus]
RFFIILFLLLAISSTNFGHPLGDLSVRDKRSDDDALVALGIALAAQSVAKYNKGGKEECYFAQTRKSKHEQWIADGGQADRPTHSRVRECGGKLKKLMRSAKDSSVLITRQSLVLTGTTNDTITTKQSNIIVEEHSQFAQCHLHSISILTMLFCKLKFTILKQMRPE